MMGGALLGIVGAIMAIPTAAVIQVGFEELFVERRERRHDLERAGTLKKRRTKIAASPHAHSPAPTARLRRRRAPARGRRVAGRRAEAPDRPAGERAAHPGHRAAQRDGAAQGGGGQVRAAPGGDGSGHRRAGAGVEGARRNRAGGAAGAAGQRPPKRHAGGGARRATDGELLPGGDDLLGGHERPVALPFAAPDREGHHHRGAARPRAGHPARDAPGLGAHPGHPRHDLRVAAARGDPRQGGGGDRRPGRVDRRGVRLRGGADPDAAVGAAAPGRGAGGRAAHRVARLLFGRRRHRARVRGELRRAGRVRHRDPHRQRRREDEEVSSRQLPHHPPLRRRDARGLHRRAGGRASRVRALPDLLSVVVTSTDSPNTYCEDVMRRLAALFLVCLAAPVFGQTSSDWTFKHRLEIRANYRNSKEESFPLRFPFPPSFLPVGQTVGRMQTVDPGSHVELSVAQVRLDLEYRNWFQAHAQVHGTDEYRRNPTSDARKIDADELWLRFGVKPEFLARPEKTSVFLQMGKFPKMERQPIRLLESYGLAATAFNRFEDVGFMAGGSVGRNLYWRVQATSGNPFYFRDPNALAGDNGIKELLTLNPNPRLKSGFPILYNAETEGYFLKTDHVQLGEGIGYRWQNDAQTFGFDAIAFHYRRDLAQREKLTGTFYGADIDLLDEVNGIAGGLPIHGKRNQETGARIYTEWRKLTAIVQYTKQDAAGLYRQGEEAEVGYEIQVLRGAVVSVMPVVRWSGLQNFFVGAGAKYPAPSVWWNWTKTDYGARIAFARNIDLTVERTQNNIAHPGSQKIRREETLATVRVRM